MHFRKEKKLLMSSLPGYPASLSFHSLLKLDIVNVQYPIKGIDEMYYYYTCRWDKDYSVNAIYPVVEIYLILDEI